MNKTNCSNQFPITIILILSIINTLYAQVEINTNEPTSVAILGTYHMSGKKGGGLFELEVDDVKTQRRQKEIKELVQRLIEYKPTKILIESQYGNDHYPNRYQKYLMHIDEDSLSRNEIEQVGFRLAVELGHKTIYPFDFKKMLKTDKLQKFIDQDTIFSVIFKNWIGQASQFFNKMNNNLKTKTILEYLQYSNSQEAINFHHQANLELLKYGRGVNYAGVDYNLAWYERNMKMFHNLTRITDFNYEKERILIIVGEAHVKILKNFIEDAKYYQYVNILNYLKYSIVK
jgi:hypothetical protein